MSKSSENEAGFGNFAGWCMIVLGVLLAVPTGGFSLLFVLAGLFGISGDKIVERNITAMEQAKDVNAAAADGCIKLLVYCLAGLVVLSLLMAAMVMGG